jgi:hypothetical protein
LVDIIEQYNDSVKIGWKNTLSDFNETLCVYAIYYLSVDEEYLCPNVTNIGLGHVDDITVKCENGTAEVVIYAYDESWSENDTVSFESGHEICPNPEEFSRMQKYVEEIPCSSYPVDRCPYLEQEECKDLNDTQIAFDDFESDEAVDKYANGANASDSDGNKYLLVEKEVYYGYPLPSSVGLAFVDLVVLWESPPDELFIRVGGYDIDATEITESGYQGNSGYAGELYVNFTAPYSKGGLTKVDVQLRIPESYIEGLSELPFGLRLGQGGESVGVDDVKVEVQCKNNILTLTEPPSSSPTIDCIQYVL